VKSMTAPPGDPGRLEQLADALDTQAQRVSALAGTTRATATGIASGADWTGDAATAYTQFTGELATGVVRAAQPLAHIAAAVRDYAGSLRAAQQQSAAADTVARQDEPARVTQGHPRPPCTTVAVSLSEQRPPFVMDGEA
jgi:WXG100 family type VII secretion target